MKTYTKPLVEVFELRVTENIAAGNAAAKAKWSSAKSVMTTFNLLAGEGNSILDAEVTTE